MSGLRLAEGLVLDTKFATEGVVVIGMRGSGKTTTEIVWCEQLYKSRIPFVLIDHKGDCYGLRTSADGKSEGLSVPIFGGLFGDAPLDANLGARMADLLVDTNLSAVLDVSKMSFGDKRKFLIAFFHRLMERHQAEPHVRCVVFGEAHRLIPQQVKNEAAELKDAAAAILLEGRSFGLGCWADTQRPARLHNDVLEECGTAIIHRIGVAATADKKRIEGWAKGENLSVELGGSLTGLADGEAWVLGPSTIGVAKRVQIDQRTTFDSGATPIAGAAARRAVAMADVDMDSIRQALADVIENAKANDPTELQALVSQLERQRAELEAHVGQLHAELDDRDARYLAVVDELRIAQDASRMPEGLLDGLQDVEGLAREVFEAIDIITQGAEEARRRGDHLLGLVGNAVKIAADAPTTAPAARPGSRGVPAVTTATVAAADGPLARAEPHHVGHPDSPGHPLGRSTPVAADRPSPNGHAESVAPPAVGDPPAHTYDGRPLALAERRIISVLYQFRHQQQLRRPQLAFLCQYHPKTKAFTNAISALRTAGLIEQGEPSVITNAGVAVAEAMGVGPLPTGEQMIAHLQNLPKMEKAARDILGVVWARWKRGVDEVTREELAELLAYHPKTKAFTNGLSRLRGLDLLEKKDPIRFHPDLVAVLR